MKKGKGTMVNEKGPGSGSLYLEPWTLSNQQPIYQTTLNGFEFWIMSFELMCEGGEEWRMITSFYQLMIW